MNEKELFEKGCFLPEWTSDIDEKPISVVYSHKKKDLQTLINELEEIKNRFQEIQAKQWHLAKLLQFNENNIVRE